MDKTIFEVEISNSGPKSYETATVMKMPASFAEFSDALQKARIKDGSFCKNELTCIHYNGLTHAMIGWNANLYDLNLFAQRLASLTEEQKKGMDALLKIKQNHRVAPIPLNQLINLTYNTDICCFAPRVSNHEELGAFLYANEMLSNEAMALLDTTEEGSGFRERLLELLGEQHQEDHGGVFTDFGYAELGGEIKDIYVCQSNETACFHRSDAPVVLEVRKGFFNDPSYDNDKTAVLNLPAADAGIWRAVEKVDAASVDECAFRCVDCLIPFLRDAINNAIDDEDGIEQADEFAKRLAQIEREWPESDMVKYKALLSVVDHPSLQDATRLMGEIDQYELRPEVAQTWGYADLRPVIGSEQGGIRPVLILQNNVGNRHSPTVIAAPITSKMGKPRLPTHVCLNRQANGLSCGSVILLEQLRTIDKSRLRERVGALDTSEMKQIDWALGVSVGLAEGYR